MPITSIDHIAIPIENVAEMLSFYTSLGASIREYEREDFHYFAVWIGQQRPELSRTANVARSRVFT